MSGGIGAAWGGLKARERFVILGGTALVLAVAFYIYAWEPMIKETAALREELPTARQTAEWMRIKKPEAERLKSAVVSGAKAGSDAEAFIKKAFENSGAQNVTIKKMDKEKVSVVAGSIKPKALFSIIEKLRREGLITPSSLKVEALPDDENVQADGVFTRVSVKGV